MSKYLEHAKELRRIEEPHYNCCQAVTVSFAKECGMSEEQAYALGAHFGRGMGRASACGAITGGLMVLGMLGHGDKETLNEYYRILRANHQGCLDCADLLKINKETGGDKKQHCDGMVFECVELVEKLAGLTGKEPGDAAAF